jgi:hypothetical protein
MMLEPLQSSGSDNSELTAVKEDESYRSLHLFVKSMPWKGVDVRVNLPYTTVLSTFQGKSRYRSGFTDLDLTIRYSRNWIVLSAGFSLPTGYDRHIDSLWLASGGVVLKTGLDANGFLKPAKVGLGASVYYNRYLDDSRIGYGSFETGIRSYLSRKLGRFTLGANASAGFKSLAFRQWGLINGTRAVGYGDPFEQREVSAGGSVSAELVQGAALTLGAGRTVYRDNSPVGASISFQIRVTPR